ncbi:MAG: type VII toxin-antitoxin system MntA family adenylyltransferase antitoxin [Candidatus Binatia bacterium]
MRRSISEELPGVESQLASRDAGDLLQRTALAGRRALHHNGRVDGTLSGELDPLVARLTTVLAARAEVLEAYLFGSAARGESRPHSDLDVAVYLDPALVGEAFLGRTAEIAAELMRASGTDAVEVVALNTAPPLLYHRVLRDGVRLVARDLEATTRRAGEALSRYCDYLPQLAKIDAAHHRRIAAGEFGR